MIEVELPDGTIVEFPDGTPPEVMKGALQKKFGAPQQPQPEASALPGLAKAAGTGVAEGVMALPGAIGDVSQLNQSLLSRGAEAMGLPEWAQQGAAMGGKLLMGPFGNMPNTSQITQAVEGITGPLYKPQNVGEEYARTAGQFAPAALLGPGRLASKAATAGTSALLSETAGQASKGTVAEPYARLGGALLGGTIPAALRRVVTPLPVSQTRKGLLATAKKEGVELTAGQATGSQKLRYAESEIGGGRVATIMDKQGEQFTSAALKRAGIKADRATPEVIDKGFMRLGNEFDSIAARNSLPPNGGLATDVAKAVTDYAAVVPKAAHVPIVQKLANDLLNAAATGLSGKQYQVHRSVIESMARKSNDPYLKTALRDMKDALDDAMEFHLSRSGSKDFDAWKKVRRQYRNIIVVEQAATAAGEKAAEGIISPSALRNATVQKHGRRNYARGQGDFADLARMGEATMKPLPQSGTAPRTAARNMGMSIPAMLGGAAGATVDPMTAVLGMMTGAAVPYAIGRGLLSKPGRAYLSNQLLSKSPLSLKNRAAISLLGSSPQLTYAGDR